MAKLSIPEQELMLSGHMGCLGCGGTLAMRYALKALGKNTMLSIPACCWAVMPGVFPYSCLNVPTIFTAFETTGASIGGIRAALKAKGKDGINVVGWAGDGGTFDIGIQALSGAVERNDDIIYICYDNEAYMNTGIQRSSSTPEGTWTTTTPVGTTDFWEMTPKKNMVEIMVAHRIPYTAVATVGYPEDLIKKIKKATKIKGPKYIQIFAPCPTGWRSPPDKTVELARMAVQTHLYPIYEVENGIYKISKKPKRREIRDYIRMQGRFGHLTDEFIENIQKQVDNEWEFLLKKEEFTQGLAK